MAITIKGIRIKSINIQRSEESGGMELNSAEYCLISSTDRILAKQSIGGYGGVTVSPSQETLELLSKFTESYQKDVTGVLGLDAE